MKRAAQAALFTSPWAVGSYDRCCPIRYGDVMRSEKMHAEEVDIDASVVGGLLAAQFPQWADLPIEPVPSDGTVNAIYRLGEDMCVRLPRVEWWAADLETEIQWLPKLARHLPLAIPEPLAKGNPDEAYPLHWAVYRWLPGEPWAADRVRDVGEAAADLAKFVAALQRVDPTGGPPSGRSKPLVMRDAETRAAIESVQGIVDTDLATAAWEGALRAPPWDGVPVWTHGDLLPPNVLVDHGRVTAVIDFGVVGLGDPACDVIAAWSILSDDARDIFRAALHVGDGTWDRGRGWALSIGLLIIPYYLDTNPPLVAMATRMVDEVLGDYG
jgi:aminoglycoside phosphotransferase (APT) family kinase protein